MNRVKYTGIQESTKKSGVSGDCRKRVGRLFGPKIGIPGSESVLPRIVQHLSAYLQEQMSPLGGPLHLLLLDHALTEHLVDRGLGETGTDPLAISIALPIVNDALCIVSDVAGQFANIFEQAFH